MRSAIRWCVAALVAAAMILGPAHVERLQAGPAGSWDSVVAAGRNEREVTVYSVFPSQIETALYEEFTKEFGIKVNYVRVGGSIPTVQKFLTEAQANQSIADVLQIWRTAALPLKDRGLLAKYDVPNSANLFPQFKDPTGYMPTPWAEAMPIIYNAELVRPADLPQTYRDLSNPRYRNQLASGIPENSANWIEIIQAWVEMYGWDWIRHYAANRVLESTREVEAAELMARGERRIAVMSQSAPAFQISQGAQMGFHWIRPIIVGQYALAVPAKAPHPNAARVFANWVLSQGHQQRWADQIGTYAVLPTVRPRTGFPPMGALRTYIPNLDIVVKDSAKIVAQYRQIMNAAR
jgi:ABC-type Fe3+ transport system substrate-binding protein